MTPSGRHGAVIAPGATIGILGGGQLGRMLALAAARLGYRCHVFCPEVDAPAGLVSAQQTTAPYGDELALADFAARVDVVTLEFENLPVAPVAWLAERVPVRPSANILAVAQDRIAEKSFLRGIGVATTDFSEVADAAAIASALDGIGLPAVLKTARMGYDGKGQVRIDDQADVGTAWKTMGGDRGIVEAFVDFEREISVIVARGVDGQMATYDAVENHHANHVLDRTIVPAPVAKRVASAADEIARQIAEALDLVGLLAVEMFVTHAGRVLVNELAPRPHNSGHWTLDACATSQFEQVVRAICGLPLGSVARQADAVMTNLIGDAVRAWPEISAEPGARLHLYGKKEIRPGRKMGHVTRLK